MYKVPDYSENKVALLELGLGRANKTTDYPSKTYQAEDLIKEGSPVIVYVDAKGDYDLALAEVSGDQLANLKGNKLTASTAESRVTSTTDNDVRVLSYDIGKKAGFHHLRTGLTVGTGTQRKSCLLYSDAVKISDETFNTRYNFNDMNPTTAAKAGLVIFSEDGVVTGIDNLEMVTPVKHPTTTRIYNLSGQYVGTSLQPLPRGIYIVNGKKICK